MFIIKDAKRLIIVNRDIVNNIFRNQLEFNQYYSFIYTFFKFNIMQFFITGKGYYYYTEIPKLKLKSLSRQS